MIPREVLARLERHKGISTPSGQWRTASLSPNNPVFRVQTGQRSWILKKAQDPRKEVAVGRIFMAYEIPCFDIESLEEDWLVYEDLMLPTLESYLSRRQGELAFRICFQLGAAAMQAELVGMKDRNLRNLCVDERGSRLFLVDYDSAFRTHLFDRVRQPYKYYAYLVRRLFFDVLRQSSSSGRACRDESISHFREGMLYEQERINRLVFARHPDCVQLAWSEALWLKTRVTTRRRLVGLLEKGCALALEREKLRGLHDG